MHFFNKRLNNIVHNEISQNKALALKKEEGVTFLQNRLRLKTEFIKIKIH